MLRLCPNCTIVDLAHHIDPQDVNHAGWVLNQCFDALPDQTVIIAVVDPYVGDATQRSVVLVFEAGQKVVVVPDNGLAGRLLARHEPVEVRVIENPALQGRGKARPSTDVIGMPRWVPIWPGP
ncbi:MAG: SAM-dependent chlorinase/fluorinase [Vampirovibrionales bacterium]